VDPIQNALKTRAEVICSPIENAKEVDLSDIGVQSESSNGDELIVILREGELPSDINGFCKQILDQCPFISFGTKSRVYVQQILIRSVPAGSYAATHAMVLSDYNSLGLPELESLEFVELQDQNNVQCLVYITDFEGAPSVIPQKQKSGSCFVATAVYGSYDAPQVKILRVFRDGVLEPSRMGRLFIHFYYRIGPICSKTVKRYNWLRWIFRYILNFFVAALRR